MLVEILPHLFLGNADDAIHFFPPKLGLVVNCTKNVPFFAPDANVQIIRIPVEDDGNEVMAIVKHWTPELFEAIVNQIMQEHKVLIHCQMGRQRSAATMAAFLSKTMKWTLEHAIEFIKKKKRDAFFPENNFLEALDAFGRGSCAPP